MSLQPAASVGVGLIAAALGPADEVVVPADEFTSVLFPILVARERGTTVREVAFERLPDEIGPRTTLVATEPRPDADRPAGRSRGDPRSGGRGRCARARRRDPGDPVRSVGVRHRSGRLPRRRCLQAPALPARRRVPGRQRQDRLAALSPLDANWRSADSPYGRYFGGPLTLAPGARRLDVSLAWIPWVGAVESLALLDSWAPTGAFEATLGLARDLAERLGIPWGGASLVCAPIGDPDGASAALRDAGVRAASRGSAIRCSAHVYTTRDDIDRAARAIEPFLTR